MPNGPQLSIETKEQISLVSGSVHPELARGIAHHMGMNLSPVELKTFPNGELYTRHEDSVRGKHVFVIQAHHHLGQPGPGCMSINDAIFQQRLLISSAKRSSASEITAVVPFLGYSRQDRKARGREPISVKDVLVDMKTSGADRLVVVDLHSAQSEVGFDGQFDHLTAQPLLLNAVRNSILNYDKRDCVVVSPDAGSTKLAQYHKEALDVGLIHMAKERSRAQSHNITREDTVPEANGRVCIMFDDIIDTAGTLVTAAEVLKKSGSKAVIVAATHGIFSDPAIKRLSSPAIDKVIVSDTVPIIDATPELGSKLQVVSVAQVIGRALMEIVTNGSVSKLFDDRNHM